MTPRPWVEDMLFATSHIPFRVQAAGLPAKLACAYLQ